MSSLGPGFLLLLVRDSGHRATWVCAGGPDASPKQPRAGRAAGLTQRPAELCLRSCSALAALLLTAHSALCPQKRPLREALVVPSAGDAMLQPQAWGGLSQTQQRFDISACFTASEVSDGNVVLVMHLGCGAKGGKFVLKQEML